MIAAFEGAPGVGKSTIARALLRHGIAVVPEVNRLFLRPVDEPSDWYLDRQNARWELAAYAERGGRTAVLDGDPLQPLWFGWLYPHERWTSVAAAASFYLDRAAGGRMRLPDRYIFLTLDQQTRARRLYEREIERGLTDIDAAAKVARYSTFAGPQQRLFEAMSSRFPGWVATINTGEPDAAGRIIDVLEEPASPPSSVLALSYAIEWLQSHPSSTFTAFPE